MLDEPSHVGGEQVQVPFAIDFALERIQAAGHIAALSVVPLLPLADPAHGVLREGLLDPPASAPLALVA